MRGRLCPAPVNSNEPAGFKIQHVPTDRSGFEIDRVVMFEIPVATTGGSRKIIQQPPFPRRSCKSLDCGPGRMALVGGRLLAPRVGLI